MLRILVVEDDAQLATTIKYLVEDNPRYRVVAIADEADAAVAAAEQHRPNIALLDLQLARGTTGFSVAVRLGDFDVPCLFVSGKAPGFAMPDLALGCLTKPFTAEEVHQALALAEDKLRGREALRNRHPVNLHLYDKPCSGSDSAGFVPSRRSLRTTMSHWLAAYQRLVTNT